MTTTAYAIGQLTRPHNIADPFGPAGRAAYLALAALCDIDLHSPNGLHAIRPDRIGRVVGRATSTADRTLRGLAGLDVGVIMVVDRAALVDHLTGDDALRPLPRGARVRGYRFTEEAYA